MKLAQHTIALLCLASVGALAAGCGAESPYDSENTANEGEALSCKGAGKPSITRNEIMSRAKSWYKQNVQYDRQGCHHDANGGYRPDCSGFVSMAWGLKSSYGTATLHEVATKISKAALQPGDVLLNAGHHVVLFEKWANKEHTKYDGYEEANRDEDMEHRVIPYPYWSGYGTYVPYRYDHVAAAKQTPTSDPSAPEGGDDVPVDTGTPGAPEDDGATSGDTDEAGAAATTESAGDQAPAAD